MASGVVPRKPLAYDLGPQKVVVVSGAVGVQARRHANTQEWS